MRSLLPGLLLLLGMPTALLACSNPARGPMAARPGEPVLQVMTYNVNFGLAGDGPTLDAIAAGGADLVLLQETNPGWERALRARLAASYPHMAFHHAPAAGGMAVASRLPLEQVRWMPPPPGGWFAAGRIVVATPLGPVQVLNLHLHPPIGDDGGLVSGYFGTRAVRQRELKHHMAQLLPNMATLVVGDFNEAANGRALSWLRSQGFGNALEEFAPGADTWRWSTSVGTLRTQLDHLTYTTQHMVPLQATVVHPRR